MGVWFCLFLWTLGVKFCIMKICDIILFSELCGVRRDSLRRTPYLEIFYAVRRIRESSTPYAVFEIFLRRTPYAVRRDVRRTA